MPDAATSLRIRMYNVGFGDAFLLFIPTDEGPKTVLVDCGVHLGGVVNKIKTVAEDIVQTLKAANGDPARIDVVVATHRHFDHISGFDLKLWQDVEVGEVWMPWTEHPTDPRARAIRRSQDRLAFGLERLNLRRNTAAGKAVAWALINALSNAGAERTLHTGFSGAAERRFLPAKSRADRTFTSPMLPGVVVHALGPSQSEKVIATLEPPEGKFFPVSRASAETDTANGDGPLFPERFEMTPAEYKATHATLSGSADLKGVRELAEIDFGAAASSLEDAINGTSLMLVLEVGDHCLLLAGDCEWGTWSEVLDDPAWCDVLRRVDVYKVSHHGSFNGTPKPFVDDLLPAEAISLVSLRTEVWPSIPRPSLLSALAAGDRTLIRSDEDAGAVADVSRHPDGLWVELELKGH